MIIGLDGPDGSGKTTLARRICGQFNMQYFHTGKPNNDAEMNELIGSLIQLSTKDEWYVVDRVPWISESVYSFIFQRKMTIDYMDPGLVKIIPSVIYFRPPEEDIRMNTDTHKSYKSPEFKKQVLEQKSEIVKRYDYVIDEIFGRMDVIKYNWKETPYSTIENFINYLIIHSGTLKENI